MLEATHATLFRLYRDGLIDGVRIDHVDGLADPGSYCRTLRARFQELAPDRPAYIVVEKILGRENNFRPTGVWTVPAATTSWTRSALSSMT